MGRFYADAQGVVFVDSDEYVPKRQREYVGVRVVEVRRRRIVGIYNPARQNAESWSRKEFVELANATLDALRQNAFGALAFAGEFLSDGDGDGI